MHQGQAIWRNIKAGGLTISDIKAFSPASLLRHVVLV